VRRAEGSGAGWLLLVASCLGLGKRAESRGQGAESREQGAEGGETGC